MMRSDGRSVAVAVLVACLGCMAGSVPEPTQLLKQPGTELLRITASAHDVNTSQAPEEPEIDLTIEATSSGAVTLPLSFGVVRRVGDADRWA